MIESHPPWCEEYINFTSICTRKMKIYDNLHSTFNRTRIVPRGTILVLKSPKNTTIRGDVLFWEPEMAPNKRPIEPLRLRQKAALRENFKSDSRVRLTGCKRDLEHKAGYQIHMRTGLSLPKNPTKLKKFRAISTMILPDRIKINFKDPAPCPPLTEGT